MSFHYVGEELGYGVEVREDLEQIPDHVHSSERWGGTRTGS